MWESVHGMYEKAMCFEVVCEGDFGMLLFGFIFFCKYNLWFRENNERYLKQNIKRISD